MTEIDITLSSKNEELYTYIAAPPDRMLEVVCTSFVAQTSIEILNKNDYIEFNIGGNKHKIYMDDYYIEMDEETVCYYINQHAESFGINVSPLNNHLLKFTCSEYFEITDMTYNFKLLTGLFFMNSAQISVLNESTNIYEIIGEYVPYYLSTPTLYLLSNLGSPNYVNNYGNSCCTGMKTMMKINNSGSRRVPIVSGNCDFTTRTTASVLSQAHFIIVDENLQRIKLLDPFTITLKIRIIQEDSA